MLMLVVVLVEVNIRGEVGVEYLSTDGLLFVRYLEHLDVFTHGVNENNNFNIVMRAFQQKC